MSNINKAQQEALNTLDGPVLIIAGPGSGKTFTLVERIVKLIQVKGIQPESILVVTFTEKAARELTTRISNRLLELKIDLNLNEMYLGTFHSICLRILEENQQYTRLKRSFTLYDQFDQQFLLYKKMKEFAEIENFHLLIKEEQSRWNQASELLVLLNKVTEEALSSAELKEAQEIEVAILGECLEKYHQLPEGLLPKLAFFASTVEELTEELKPELERQLAEHGISTDKILVNVGDTSHTSSDDIRNFNNLDVVGTEGAEKQFILLVNKGREGWNCRSLFGVAMYRSPKSKVFVLQATMRCLRSIGKQQYTGSIYLSKENYEILDTELQANFRMTASDFTNPDPQPKKMLNVQVREDVKIKLKHVKQTIKLKEKEFLKGTSLDLDPTNEDAWHELTNKYLIIQTTTTNLQANDFNTAQYTKSKDRTSEKEKVEYTGLSLVAEISRYLNLSPIKIERMLDQTKEGLESILFCVNQFNELLYDVVIPRLFTALYDQEIESETIEKEVQLIIPPAIGELSFYEIAVGKGGTSTYADTQENYRDKSFNLDTYTFDSNPEYALFWDLLKDDDVEKIYFTGMFTDKSKTDFYFQYVDPDSYALRNYYPDFLVRLKNGQYIIVEVKGDHQYDDPTVVAKAKAAKEYASHSQIEYKMIRGTDANAHIYQQLLGRKVLPNNVSLI